MMSKQDSIYVWRHADLIIQSTVQQFSTYIYILKTFGNIIIFGQSPSVYLYVKRKRQE